MRRPMILAAGGGMVLALAAATSVLAWPGNGTVKIVEQNNRYLFTPGSITVGVGQSVSWSNGTDAPHTVTSDAGSELASGTVAAGASFSHAFSAPGTYAYHCMIHPYMTGRIVVLPAGATLPPTDGLPASVSGSDPSSVPIAGLLLMVLAAVAAGGALLAVGSLRRSGRM